MEKEKIEICNRGMIEIEIVMMMALSFRFPILTRGGELGGEMVLNMEPGFITLTTHNGWVESGLEKEKGRGIEIERNGTMEPTSFSTKP